MIDPVQDHFSERSSVICAGVMLACGPQCLAHLLQQEQYIRQRAI